MRFYKLISICICLFVAFSCGEKKEDKSSIRDSLNLKSLTEIAENSADTTTTPKERFIESLLFSQGHYLNSEDEYGYIYDNQIQSKFEKYFSYRIASNITFVQFEKNDQPSKYLLVKYINLQDTIPIIRLLKTNLSLDEIIRHSFLYQLNQSIGTIEDAVQEIPKGE